ncbi:MAG: MlaD family protein [Acetobacteraceae bacterium]|jgi:paraquat-inducible protein B|nr:MlaD family protein [Acetobacteraceae bacterium]
MEQKTIYFRVGVVILSGLAMIAGLILWVGSDLFRARGAQFETYFAESVQGLDIGAGVRFRGVPIGRVTEIAMAAADYPTADVSLLIGDNAFTFVVVRFEVFADRVATRGQGDFRRMIEAGLRVRLAGQGITGVLYLEADFLDARRFPPLAVPWTPRYTVIPAAPSTLTQFTSAAERLVTRLEEADLPLLITNINTLVAGLSESVTTGETYRMIVEVSDLAAEIRTRAGSLSPGVEAAVADAQGALAVIRDILQSRETRQMTTGIAAASARLPQTAGAIEQAARRLEGVMADADRDLAPLLRDLRLTAENLRAITENMRQYPSQVLFGAPPPRTPAPAPQGAPQ